MRDPTTDRPFRALWPWPIVAESGWAVPAYLSPVCWLPVCWLPVCWLPVFLSLVVLSSGCQKKTPPSPAATAGSASASASVAVPVEPIGIKAIDALPVTMRVAQRSTTAVPGTADQLSIEVNDINRGEVKITVLEKDRKPIAGPVSVKQDQAVSFHLGENAYAARVVELSNALIGDDDFVTIVIDQLSERDAPATGDRSTIDSAAFQSTQRGKSFAEQQLAQPQSAQNKFPDNKVPENKVADNKLAENGSAPNKPAAKKLTEKQKIERLLAVIEAQHNAKFIRNGTAYTPTEAADHLRMKLENARKRVRTARDFIDKVGSRSSVSGKDYLIELPDGRVLTTRQFLREELVKIEQCAKESE